MGAPRRLALLRWARAANAWVVEDDYDSEFRFSGQPLPCLQGLDAERCAPGEVPRVFYVGSFSKTLAPGLRLGYLVVPAAAVDAVRAARAAIDRHPPSSAQGVLADFIGEGHYARHVRRVRALYAERQAILVGALQTELDGLLTVGADAAGLHLVAWLPPGVDGRDAEAAARAEGVRVYLVSRYAPARPTSPRPGGLLLGYAGFNGAAIREGVVRLGRALRTVAPSQRLPRADHHQGCQAMTTNFDKTPIRFPSAEGVCAGDLYLPATSRPSPVVIMAHGIGADRSFGLASFAERFAAAGLACLVFDYRRFGDSPGTPRRLVSPRGHVEDYLSAIRFVRRQNELDVGRIGLWGTSFSGGHVLVAAARAREDVRAVVAQVPFVSGIASSLAYPLRYLLPATAMALADGLAGLTRRGRLTVPVARERGLALLASPDAYPGLRALVPKDSPWPVHVPAQVFLSVLGYYPAWRAARVRAPTLIVAGTGDAICPIRAVRRAARQLPDCRLEEFPIGHFDGYQDEWFDRFVKLETRFFQERLGVEQTRAPEPS